MRTCICLFHTPRSCCYCCLCVYLRCMLCVQYTSIYIYFHVRLSLLLLNTYPTCVYYGYTNQCGRQLLQCCIMYLSENAIDCHAYITATATTTKVTCARVASHRRLWLTSESLKVYHFICIYVVNTRPPFFFFLFLSRSAH